MTAKVRRLKSMPVTTPLRSSPISVMSEASSATSRAAAQRDADIRLRQRGGVVDAVAHHRHHRAVLLQMLHFFRLMLWQHLGHHLLDAEQAPTASATRRWSPVSIAVCRPMAFSRRITSTALGRSVSATASTPSNRPSAATPAACSVRRTPGYRTPRRAG